MAGIRKKGDGYYCTFRFHGERFYFALGNVTEAQALAKGAEVDETLKLLDRGRLSVPENITLEKFVAAGGKAPVVFARPETTTVRKVFDQYLAAHANGTIEESSLGTAKSHLSQFTETVGERFRMQAMTLLDLQRHVDRRRKKRVSPVTLKKELATVRACWNWAVQSGILKGTFPGKGLRFPKEEEKEPFRTFAEIEAIITAEKPASSRQDLLWEALYLTRPEIEEFLLYMRERGTHPWVYPMVAVAAFSGARRSEMLRALATDVDLAGGVVTIREKKRLKGKRSTRTAPIAPKLAEVLREWLKIGQKARSCSARRIA